MTGHRVLATLTGLISIALFTTALAAEQHVELGPGDTLVVECASRLSGQIRGDTARLACQAVATATGTLQATATKTATVIATATQTVVATLTATSTATATPTATGGALCAHNDTQWHGLTGPNGCHYEHEHGDNPAALDSMFGPAGAWAGVNQSISYPWQTFSSAGQENAVKHTGYKWIVRQGIPCVTSNNQDGCVTDYRALVHAQGSASDANARHHSTSFEGRGCRGSVCGTIRTGSWHDFGHLALFDDQNHEYCPAIPSNPAGFQCGNGAKRNHFDTSPGVSHARNAAWYPSFTPSEPNGEPWVGISLSFHDIFGPTSGTNPSQQLFYPRDWFGNNLYNNSLVSMNELFIVMDDRPNTHTQRRASEVAAIDPDHDHVANYTGYTDRYGNLVSGCTAAALDCIPLQIVGLPMVGYHYRDDNQGALRGYPKEHDTSPAMQHPTDNSYPEWIKFPN